MTEKATVLGGFKNQKEVSKTLSGAFEYLTVLLIIKDDTYIFQKKCFKSRWKCMFKQTAEKCNKWQETVKRKVVVCLKEAREEHQTRWNSG